MDLPLESTLSVPAALPIERGRMAGRPLEEWNEAYCRIERYFDALQLRNRVLLGHRVNEVLARAMQRAVHETSRSATELATEEMDKVLHDWFARVLQQDSAGADALLSTRGRLALLLADMPVRWQEQFLHPGPWSEEFVTAMREAYLRAGPEFQFSQITARPLELGPIATLADPKRLPYRLMMIIWIVGALLLIALFISSHLPAK